MIKTILYNLIRKLKLFLTNKTNNEFLSKLYVEEIHKKLRIKQVNQYALNGFKVYSQNEEDGIIEKIFDDIGTTNEIFCEIGIGDCVENNSHLSSVAGMAIMGIAGENAEKISDGPGSFQSNFIDCLSIIHSIADFPLTVYSYASKGILFIVR